MSNKKARKELEQRVTTIQTALNAIEASISKFDNIIEECRLVEEEVCQMEVGEASPDQPDSGEQAMDMDMADQENSGHQGSSDPHMVTTKDNLPLASGGNTITSEEEEILLAGMPQSEDRSPVSETTSVSGGMAELHPASPSCSGPEEEETPP